MTFRNKKRENKKATGAGVLGAIVGATATYFFYGTKKGKEKRREIKKSMDKAREEIEDRVDKAGDITEEKYEEIVDTVTEKYRNIKNIDKSELKDMANDMKRHWGNIKKQVKEGKKSTPRR